MVRNWREAGCCTHGIGACVMLAIKKTFSHGQRFCCLLAGVRRACVVPCFLWDVRGGIHARLLGLFSLSLSVPAANPRQHSRSTSTSEAHSDARLPFLQHTIELQGFRVAGLIRSHWCGGACGTMNSDFAVDGGACNTSL